MVIIKNREALEKTLKSHYITLCFFSSSICVSCDNLCKTLLNIDEKTICKIDIWENEDLFLEYKIDQLPTLIYFKNKIIIKTLIGSQSLTSIKNAFSEVERS